MSPRCSTFCAGQNAAKNGPAGIHGYCMSGPYALAAAARYPDRIAAAASFYGTWLVNDAEESPHLNLAKIKGELHIACAEHDELAPLPMVEELKTLFAARRHQGRDRDVYGRAPRLRVPRALVLRRARRRAPLGAADRALPADARVNPSSSRRRPGPDFSAPETVDRSGLGLRRDDSDDYRDG